MARLLIRVRSATKAPIPNASRRSCATTARSGAPCGPPIPKAGQQRSSALSAHYGLRDATTPIAHCDARLTQDLAERMIAGIVSTRWPRLPLRRPDTHGIQAGADIASLTCHGAEPFAEIVLIGGRLYVAVTHALVRGFAEMGCVRRDACVSVINGPIGRMRQDLRAWLAAYRSRGGGP